MIQAKHTVLKIFIDSFNPSKNEVTLSNGMHLNSFPWTNAYNIITFSKADIQRGLLSDYLQMPWGNAYGRIRKPSFIRDLIFRFPLPLYSIPSPPHSHRGSTHSGHIWFDFNVTLKISAQMTCSSINWIVYCRRSTLHQWGDRKPGFVWITKSLVLSGIQSPQVEKAGLLHCIIKYVCNVYSSETPFTRKIILLFSFIFINLMPQMWVFD